MLTEVMRHYGLARPPVDAGFFETEHHAQVARDIQAAITRGGLIALTAIIGAGKTVLSRRLRAELEREDTVIVSRSLSLDKARIAMPLLVAALFYDLSPEKNVAISNNSERRERDLQDLFRRAKKPVALFIDDAHDLHPKTLVALKRLIELVTEGGGQLSVVLIGHPKLKNDLRRPRRRGGGPAARQRLRLFVHRDNLPRRAQDGAAHRRPDRLRGRWRWLRPPDKKVADADEDAIKTMDCWNRAASRSSRPAGAARLHPDTGGLRFARRPGSRSVPEADRRPQPNREIIRRTASARP